LDGFIWLNMHVKSTTVKAAELLMKVVVSDFRKPSQLIVKSSSDEKSAKIGCTTQVLGRRYMLGSLATRKPRIAISWEDSREYSNGP
jgi:hypothetical protein